MTNSEEQQPPAWPEAKLERARAHLEDLRSHIGAWLATQPYRIDSVIADDRLSYRVYLRLDTPPPLVEWATITGDCLHNLRSALDAAVWDLAHGNGGAPTNPRALQFPFAESPEDWLDRSRRMLAGLSTEVLQRIENVQPYNHTTGNGRISALSLLNTLSIDDKHRAGVAATINPTEASRRGQIQFESDAAAARHRPENARMQLEMRDGAILHEETTIDPIVNVRGEFNARLVITISTPAGPSPLLKTLELIDRAVAIALNGLYGFVDISVAPDNQQADGAAGGN